LRKAETSISPSQMIPATTASTVMTSPVTRYAPSLAIPMQLGP